MKVFTAEQVTELFVSVGVQVEAAARNETDHSASLALHSVAHVLQHSMDWEWELKQLDEPKP